MKESKTRNETRREATERGMESAPRGLGELLSWFTPTGTLKNAEGPTNFRVTYNGLDMDSNITQDTLI